MVSRGERREERRERRERREREEREEREEKRREMGDILRPGDSRTVFRSSSARADGNSDTR